MTTKDDGLQEHLKALNKKIPLVEMFGPTVQGEGSVIGLQTYFLRFGLCDYKCTMCDSMHAVDPSSVRMLAKRLSQQEILDEFRAFHKPNTTRWVTFSGGNPAIHDLGELVSKLHLHGFKVSVETQGTFTPDWLKHIDDLTISPKGPGMGENTDLKVLDTFMYENTWIGGKTTKFRPVSLKVVIFDQRDIEFAAMIYERYCSGGSIPMFLSQGNPNPPDKFGDPKEGSSNQAYTDMVMEQIGRYKMLFEDISQHPVLSNAKWLPQWHLLAWGNKKGF